MNKHPAERGAWSTALSRQPRALLTNHYKQPTLCGLRFILRSSEPPVFCCTTPPTRTFPSDGRYCLCSFHWLVTLPVAAGSRRAGIRPLGAKWTPARLLIAKSARRRRKIAMPTAGSGPDSASTVFFCFATGNHERSSGESRLMRWAMPSELCWQCDRT